MFFSSSRENILSGASGTLKLSVNGNGDYMSVSDNGIEVVPGTSVELKVADLFYPNLQGRGSYFETCTLLYMYQRAATMPSCRIKYLLLFTSLRFRSKRQQIL